MWACVCTIYLWFQCLRLCILSNANVCILYRVSLNIRPSPKWGIPRLLLLLLLLLLLFTFMQGIYVTYLTYLKDRTGYSHLKEEALDRTMWRNRFRGGFGPVVRQNTEWWWWSRTNPVSGDLYNVAGILWLLSTVHVMWFRIINVLYFYLTTLRRMWAVFSMAVVCSSLMSCFPGMLLKYNLNDYETVPVAPVLLPGSLLVLLVTRVLFLPLNSPYFKNCSASLLITFLSPETAMPICCVSKKLIFN